MDGHTGTDFFRSLFPYRWVPNAGQWRRQPIEHTKYYCLAVIEFDDQGWFQDFRQRDALERFLNQKANRNEDLLIVVFIHGWQHNADPDDISLLSFRSVLHQACLSESNRRSRQILGVYLSWRGLSLSGNDALVTASFWTRKNRRPESRSDASGKSLLGYALSKQRGTNQRTSKDAARGLTLSSRVTPLEA
jgi:hypothetical protein